MSIEITAKDNFTPLLIFGGIAVVYGIVVYYFMPYALLNANYALLLDVFFAILIGMIVGLVMITNNF